MHCTISLLCCRSHCLQDSIALHLMLYIQVSAKKEGFYFFSVSTSTVCIQFNQDKLEIGGKMVKKVLAETHTGSQLHNCERN